MKNIFLSVLFLPYALFGMETSEISFKEAQLSELQEILALDRKITYEHFKPIFLLYTDRSLGHETDKILEEDLEADEDYFKKAILGAIPNKLYAISLHSKIIGFSYIYKNSQSLTIDLLLIDKAYRQQGIGRNFFEYILKHTRATHCRVAILSKNQSAIRFWESLGFKQCTTKPQDMGNEFPEDCVDCYAYYEYQQ